MLNLSSHWQTWMARQTHTRPRTSDPPLRANLYSVEQLARYAKAIATNHHVVTWEDSNRLLKCLVQNEEMLTTFNHQTLKRHGC